MNAIRTILLWLGLILAGTHSAFALTAFENRVWEIFSIGYDAPTAEATDLESRVSTSTSNYDTAPTYRATNEEIPTEANRALFGQNAEFKAAEGGVGTSELGNALSGLGSNPLGRNLNTLDEFSSGAGFSGVYDVESGKFLAYPSGATTLSNGGTPLNLVDQFGGHADVNNALTQLLGTSSNNRLGFSMTLDEAGDFSVGWNSRTINVPNPNFPGRTVPENMRQPVLDAIMQATGRKAY